MCADAGGWGRRVTHVSPDDILWGDLYPLLCHGERVVVRDTLREDVGTHLEVALHERAALGWAVRQGLSQLVDLNIEPRNFLGTPVNRVDSLTNEGDPAESVSGAGDVIKKMAGPDVTVLGCCCQCLVVLVRVHSEREGGTRVGLRLAGGLDSKLHDIRGSNFKLLACIESFVEQIRKTGAATIDPCVGDASGDEGEEFLEIFLAVREFWGYVGD